MTDAPRLPDGEPAKSPNAPGPRAEAERLARLAREAAALRDNLRRRKQQPRPAKPTDPPP